MGDRQETYQSILGGLQQLSTSYSSSAKRELASTISDWLAAARDEDTASIVNVLLGITNFGLEDDEFDRIVYPAIIRKLKQADDVDTAVLGLRILNEIAHNHQDILSPDEAVWLINVNDKVLNLFDDYHQRPAT